MTFGRDVIDVARPRKFNVGLRKQLFWMFLLLVGPLPTLHAADAPSSNAEEKPKRSLLSDPTALLITMASHLEKDPNPVVVTVEDLPITQGEVAGVIRSLPPIFGNLGMGEVYRYAIDVLIRQKVMMLKAKKLALDKDPVLIQKGKVAFERILAEAWLARQADSAVSEQALREAYTREIADRPGPDEVRARVILVPTEAEARELIAKVNEGVDFADLARIRSKDPTASEGGDLGYISLEAVAPEVGSAMFALYPGQTTPFPVRGAAGYFILRVEGRRQRPTPGFDESRDKLERELRASAVQRAITSLLNEIKMVPGPKAEEMLK